MCGEEKEQRKETGRATGVNLRSCGEGQALLSCHPRENWVARSQMEEPQSKSKLGKMGL